MGSSSVGYVEVLVVASLLIYAVRVLKPVLKASLTRKVLFRAETSSHEINVSALGGAPLIHVLIPLHNEQGIVLELHSRLCVLARLAPRTVRFYLITTDREHAESETPSTRACLDEFTWPDTVVSCHLARDVRGKGAVLNAALGSIPANSADWIGVFDADSQPDWRIFEFLGGVEDADVVQQPSTYLRNYDRLNPPLRMMAAFQTAWCLGSEVPRYLAYSSERMAKRRIIHYPYLYPVSHGLFIKLWAIRALGGFPSTYEDLRLGIPLVTKELRLVVAPYCDSCCFAESITDWVRQSGNWMNGSWFLIRDFWRLLRRGTETRTRIATVLTTTRGLVSNILWVLEGALYLMTMAAAVRSGSAPALIGSAAILILVWMCYGFLLDRVTAPLLPSTGAALGRRAGILYRWALLGPFLRSLGPFIGTIRVLATMRISEKPAWAVTPKRPATE